MTEYAGVVAPLVVSWLALYPYRMFESKLLTHSVPLPSNTMLPG